MTSIIKSSSFQPSEVNFAPAGQNKMGGKIVYVSYGKEKNKIFLQTPEVSLPFGISSYVDKATGAVSSFSLDISFRDLETNPDLRVFYDKMKELDGLMVNTAVSKSVEWLGKNKSKDVILDNYKPLVKPPNDPKYSDVMRVKILWDSKKDEFGSKFYDENKLETTHEYISKGTTAKMLLELRSVWFVQGSFGIKFALVQLKVVSRPQKFIGCALLDDDEEETEDYSTPDLGKTLDDF